MLVQIEITTRCNFRCFYCAGREMTQAHMDWDRFAEILNRVPKHASRVSLQGEGEPMSHPRFWEMVQAIRERGLVPYTITNGSLIEPEAVAAAFPTIGLSIDTVDAELAERIGRFKLDRVITNLDRLLTLMVPERIVVHTVYLGQPLETLREFLRERKLTKHIIQPLQSKADYARYYSGVNASEWGPCTFSCRYLEQPLMRYYAIDGTELPCCFIKDTTGFVSAEHLRAQLEQKSVPGSCAGCRMIFPHAKIPAVDSI
jgi:MoaA/NifB/PqqE/SkfB family radical SAM enzyme